MPEYISFPEDLLALKPTNLTFEQAAAVPMAALTALQALRDPGRIEAGQKVLINGASGGIGTFAVQIAKSFGAEVTGVCSTRNVDLVRSIGADHVIDYTREDFTRRHPAIRLDPRHGGQPLARGIQAGVGSEGDARRDRGGGGRWLGPLTQILSAIVTSPFVGQRLVPVYGRQSKDDLQVLTGLIEAGKVTPVIDRTYPLCEVPEAIRYLETRHTRGKLVITV